MADFIIKQEDDADSEDDKEGMDGGKLYYSDLSIARHVYQS